MTRCGRLFFNLFRLNHGLTVEIKQSVKEGLQFRTRHNGINKAIGKDCLRFLQVRRDAFADSRLDNGSSGKTHDSPGFRKIDITLGSKTSVYPAVVGC